jgi:cell division protein ZapA
MVEGETQATHMSEEVGFDSVNSDRASSDSARTVVSIFDHQYRIGSASTGSDAIQQAAALLDERMRQIAVSTKRRAPLEVAILAAMELADEVLRYRDRRERLLNEADERISGFTRRLEGEIGRAAPDDEDSGSQAPPDGADAGPPGSGPAPRF